MAILIALAVIVLVVIARRRPENTELAAGLRRAAECHQAAERYAAEAAEAEALVRIYDDALARAATPEYLRQLVDGEE